MVLRRVLIRIAVPVLWRGVARVQAARLLRFGITEKDSEWQILHALDDIDDPATRARVLQHALEESHHAAEFTRVSLAVDERLPPKPLPPRNPIYETGSGAAGLAAFAAYANVGEVDVFEQFDAYAVGIGPGEARSVFRESKLDELGHVGLTRAILDELCPDKRHADWLVTRVRLRRAWDVWLRFGRFLGEVNTTILLCTLYFLAGVLLAVPARRRLRTPHARG